MYDGEHAQGCVFILYSPDSAIDRLLGAGADFNLDDISDVKLCSPSSDIYSKFGHAIATSTNDDGNYEIYIGAPSYGTRNVTYQGMVYYYESYQDEHKNIKFRVGFSNCLYNITLNWMHS